MQPRTLALIGRRSPIRSPTDTTYILPQSLCYAECVARKLNNLEVVSTLRTTLAHGQPAIIAYSRGFHRQGPR